jgi:ribonuclease HI
MSSARSFLSKYILDPKYSSLMPKKSEYYVVARGRVPGIYKSWFYVLTSNFAYLCRAETETHVSGYPNALHKGFRTESEASQWFLENSDRSTETETGLQSALPVATLLPKFPNTFNPSLLESLPPVTLLSPTHLAPPLPSEEALPADEFAAQDEKVRKQYNIPPDAQIIYTDGACPSNGLNNSRAGIGIFFSPSSPHNISRRLPGPQQTNQRAELFAVLKALEFLHIHKTPGVVVIMTDSKYVISALTVWAQKWEREGWKSVTGTDVVSKDLFKRARDLLGSLRADGVFVHFKHVRGHSGLWGNEEADRLAVRGAWMEPNEDENYDDEELDKEIAEMDIVL